jgi:hypothetical protein
VAVEQKFHNTSNELQHRLVSYQRLNILLLLVAVVVVLGLVLVAVVLVGCLQAHNL